MSLGKTFSAFRRFFTKSPTINEKPDKVQPNGESDAENFESLFDPEALRPSKTLPKHIGYRTSTRRPRVSLATIFQNEPSGLDASEISIVEDRPSVRESSHRRDLPGRRIDESTFVRHDLSLPRPPRQTSSPKLVKTYSSPPSAPDATSFHGGEKCTRMHIGYAERMGRRKEMQDVVVIKTNYAKHGDRLYSYFAVFDGHGGRNAAELAGQTLHEVLAMKLKKMTPAKGLRESYLEVNDLIRDAAVMDGTCALVALFVDNTIYVANAGDSEAVLFRNGKPKVICPIHKPKHPDEWARITEIGGFVTSRGRVNGVLAVSRALGDIPLQPFVTPEPEVTETQLYDGDEFLIMACDGVWDVLSKEQACASVAAEADPERASVALRDRAFSCGSGDNISVVVVKFLHAAEGRS